MTKLFIIIGSIVETYSDWSPWNITVRFTREDAERYVAGLYVELKEYRRALGPLVSKRESLWRRYQRSQKKEYDAALKAGTIAEFQTPPAGPQTRALGDEFHRAADAFQIARDDLLKTMSDKRMPGNNRFYKIEYDIQELYEDPKNETDP